MNTLPPQPVDGSSTPRRYRLGHTLKIHGRVAFAQVFAGKVRHSVGPLSVWARPNALPNSRLGLSVNRAVGTAVQRNRLKRLLREAFRLRRHELPQGYDWVVVIYKHTPRKLDEYQKLLQQATAQLDRVWQKKQRTTGG